MTPENFVNWLRGYFDMNGAVNIPAAKAAIIADRLALVSADRPDCGYSPPKFDGPSPAGPFLPCGDALLPAPE